MLLAGCAASPRPSPVAAKLAQEPVVDRASEKLSAPLLVHDVGFDTPEGVLFDADSDFYLVSNVVGSALERDGRAFISRVRPDGTIATLKWIEGGRAGVEMHAPKGMAIQGNVLYVADIDTLRRFDSRSGKPLPALALPGATFLHDVASAADGSIYVSDSGLGQGLTPSGSDAIYRIQKGDQITRIASSSELGQPSGLCTDASGLYVVSFGSGELYRLDEHGARENVQRLPKGSLDGIAIDRGVLYVSSWEGEAIYARNEGGFEPIVEHVHAPADLAIDHVRKRLLYTRYNENALSIHPL